VTSLLEVLEAMRRVSPEEKKARKKETNHARYLRKRDDILAQNEAWRLAHLSERAEYYRNYRKAA
jgi:hypothetical protein